VLGDDAWEQEWAQLLVGRYVSIVLDCDAFLKRSRAATR
jgi:hypothetical protein